MDCIVHGVTKNQTWLGDFHFHWWSSGWESTCQCRVHAFHPWSGKISHVKGGQLSLCPTTTELGCPRTCSLQQEKPPQRESPWVAMKTQISEKKKFFLNHLILIFLKMSQAKNYSCPHLINKQRSSKVHQVASTQMPTVAIRLTKSGPRRVGYKWYLTLSLGVRINKERWGLRQTSEPGPFIMTQHNYRPLLPKVLTPLENPKIRILLWNL